MAKKRTKAASRDDSLVQARVLVDCEAGKCNTVVEADADQIAIWAANGLVDDAPEAIDAAEAEAE